MAEPKDAVNDQHYVNDLIALLTSVNAPPRKLDSRALSVGRVAIIEFLAANLSANHEIPKGIVSKLANALRVVESGHLDPLFLPHDYGRQGTPGRELLETQVIRLAVRYRIAVQLRNIHDRSPIKSIIQSFGGDAVLNRRTVQIWVQEFGEKVIPLPEMPTNEARLLLDLAGTVYRHQYTRSARATK